MPVALGPSIVTAAKRGIIDAVIGVLPRRPQDVIAPINLPKFLADPPPGNPIGDFQHRAGRAACDRWARGDRSSILPGKDLAMRSLCTPYLDDDLPGEPTTAPPFPGGQCPGVRYLFSFRGRLPDPLTDTGVVQTIRTGPLGLDTSLNPGDVCLGGAQYRRWTLTSPQGNIGLWAGCNATIEFLGVQALDPEPPGGCGSLDDEFDSGEPEPSPDPNPGPIGPPTGYPFPDIDIRIGPEGDVIIDFGDGEPPVVIDPSTDDDGDDGDDGGDGGPPPGDVGEPGDSEDADGDGNASGCAPDGSVLVALKVNFLQIPPKARQFAEGVYRAVCYAYLGTLEGLDLDPAGAVMRDGQFILAEKENLTCWEVRANTGWRLSVTPYYRALEENP